MRDLAPELVAKIRATLPPEKQAMLNATMTEMMVQTMTSEARKHTPDIIAAMKQRADDVVDLKDVIAKNIMLLGPSGLERIIYTVARRELTFIEYYGGIFGFFLGLLQWVVLQYAGDVALPIVGAFVGTVTNWLAIQMLFKPEEPTKYLGGLVTYQGMFPKHQHEIASKMGQIAADDLIIPSEVFAELADKMVPMTIDALAVETWEAALRTKVPHVFQVADALIPEDSRPAMRGQVAELATERLADAKSQVVELATAQIDIHGILGGALQNLKKSQFEQLIRGLFEREEGYLIIFGGLLGCAIGALQLFIVGWVG